MADQFIRSLNGYKLKDETAREQIATLQESFDGHNHDDSYELKTDASAKLTEAKEYADTQIAALVNSAPETLDTLGELATAFQENEEVVAALDAAISNKADKSEVAIADWNVSDENNPAYIKNRTHYGVVKTIEVIEETTVELIQDVGGDIDYDGIDDYEHAIAEVSVNQDALDENGYFIVGTYNVVVDGDSYSIELTQPEGSFGAKDVYTSWPDWDDYPFCIIASGKVVAPFGTNNITISVSYMSETVHTIDPKYLPPRALVGALGTASYSEVFNDYENNIASGNYSHAEGLYTEASGLYSHAEGDHTDAIGNSSHAEGSFTVASGWFSHAEGNTTKASGWFSHAEGCDTIASGEYSHAEGSDTIASGEAQHVQGKFNVADADSVYAHIVGNGESNTARSNAHTLDWSGNAWYSGKIYIGGTVTTSEDGVANYSGASEEATKADVDANESAISLLQTKVDGIAAIANDEIDAICGASIVSIEGVEF